MHRVECFLIAPRASPSSRYTVYNLVSYLQDYDVELNVHPFYSPSAYEKIRKKPKPLKKISLIASGYLRLLTYLTKVRHADIFWIQRYAAPIGTGFLASVLTKVLRKPLVFGYDDAVYLNRIKGNKIRKLFGSWRSIDKVIAMSDFVLAWNHTLGDHAQTKNPNVLVHQSAINVSRYDQKVNKYLRTKKNRETFVLGWIGSPSSAPYLEIVRLVLEKLGREGPVELRLIGGDMPDILNVTVKRIRWQQSTEIDELCKVDVGIATLPDDEWARGKSGLKVVQYMGCGLPVVASCVGAHLDLLDSGKEGFLVHTDAEWLDALRNLRDNNKLRKKMGVAGRKRVHLKHDFAIIAKDTAEIFIEICQNKRRMNNDN